MEDLEKDEQVASVNEDGTPTEGQDPTTQESDEERDLTDEELQAEIDRLQEEVTKEEDAKEKRHKQQDIGWKMKILKERDKAKNLEKENLEKEERLKSFENTLIEEAYSKSTDDNFGLPYFENLYKSNPDLANKVAQDKFGKKNAKELILETKRTFAEQGDDKLKEEVSKEDLRKSLEEEIYHKIALEQTESMFSDLSDTEQLEAKEYFEDIIEGKKLNVGSAKKYAEMAKLYATRNRAPSDAIPPAKKTQLEKEEILAGKASTSIGGKSGTNNETDTIDVKSIRQQLLNSGISQYQVDLMYPL